MRNPPGTWYYSEERLRQILKICANPWVTLDLRGQEMLDEIRQLAKDAADNLRAPKHNPY